MHFADIQALLKKNKVTQRQIAEEEDVSETVVKDVIRGTATSRRIAYAVAAHTGFCTQTLWPGKYPETPTRQERRKRNLGLIQNT